MSNQKKAPKATADCNGYEPPSFQCSSLALITLGGSPGAGDSGAEGTEMPFGSGQSADFYESDDQGDWDW